MPKVKITTETADVLKQAEAAANDPVLTPLETQCVQDLMQPTLDAIGVNAQTINGNPTSFATPAHSNPESVGITQAEDLDNIQSLEKAMAEIDQKIIVAKDHVSSLEAKKKEIKEQYLDAIKSKPALYKSKLQNSFNF